MNSNPRYNDTLLEQIRARLPLVEQVRTVAPDLARKGKFWWACCPFHKERTPSFHVRPDEGHYHCFGCGAHGDIFTFLMETKGMTFPEAVESLADQAGVALPKVVQDPVQAQQRASGQKALERAQAFYRQQAGHVQAYLQKRGIRPETQETFGLGYAPDAWDDTHQTLLQEGFTVDVLHETGLSIYNEKRQSSYDRFRGRLMFPIQDLKNRVIAFGGRIVGEGEPKYLNSPDTPFFNKSYTLYNLNRAREHIRAEDQAVLVEGYMDVIALWQAGVKTALAPMGTAVTPEQIQMLWQYHNAPLVCLDGDSAGQSAALRTAKRVLPILKAGKTLRFVFLAEGEDPDSLIQKGGINAWKSALQEPVTLEEVLWQSISQDQNLTSGEGRAATEQAMNSLLADMQDETMQRHFKQALKDRLWQARTGKKAGTQGQIAMTGGNPKWVPKLEGDQGVRILLALACRLPQFVKKFDEEFSEVDFENQELIQLSASVLQAVVEKGVAPAELPAYLERVGTAHTMQALLASPLIQKAWAEEDDEPHDASLSQQEGRFRALLHRVLETQRAQRQRSQILAGLQGDMTGQAAEDAFAQLQQARRAREQTR